MMTTYAAVAVADAIITALRADAGVAAIVGVRVYDEPPQDVAFPWVEVRDAETLPFDTDCTVGAETLLTIVAHTRPASGGAGAGQRATNALAATIYEALHRATPAVTGHALINLTVDIAVTRGDSDGISHECVMRARAVTQPTA